MFSENWVELGEATFSESQRWGRIAKSWPWALCFRSFRWVSHLTQGPPLWKTSSLTKITCSMMCGWSAQLIQTASHRHPLNGVPNKMLAHLPLGVQWVTPHARPYSPNSHGHRESKGIFRCWKQNVVSSSTGCPEGQPSCKTAFSSLTWASRVWRHFQVLERTLLLENCLFSAKNNKQWKVILKCDSWAFLFISARPFIHLNTSIGNTSSS